MTTTPKSKSASLQTLGVRLGLCALMLPFAGCGACEPTTECRDNPAQVCGDDEQCFVNDDDTTGCAIPCDAENPCDNDFACREVTDLDGVSAGACVELTDNRATGDSCGDDAQCASGICEGDADNERCREACDADGACDGDGNRCVLVRFRSMCLESLADYAAGEECESGEECLSGICTLAPFLSPGGEDNSYAICTDKCGAADVCPGDDVCGTLDVGVGVCLPSLPVGEACPDASYCPGALCVAESANTDGVCRERCVDAKDPCATAETACVALSDPEVDPNTEYVCLPVDDDAGQSYPDATTTCARNTDCLSGLCGQFGGAGVSDQQICAVACDATEANECDACPTDSICWPFDASESLVVGLCGPIPPEGGFPCLSN